jgi:hypothetical protein
MADAGDSTKRGDEGLSADERRMLGALSPGGSVSQEKPKPESSRFERPPEASVPRSEGFSAEEAHVLSQAREETERLSHAERERMFQPGSEEPPDEPLPGLESLPARAAEPTTPPASEPSAFEKSGWGRALSVTLEWVNAPFLWLPRAYRLGLGLCGVLLLITLLIVILIKSLKP